MTESARDWMDVLQALLTPTIALAALGIGFAQWWTAQNKLKLDLFDRRWAIYHATRDMLAEIFTRGRTSTAAEQRFLEGTRGARWLLDERAEEYLTRELWAKATLLGAANAALERLGPEDTVARATEQRNEVVKWAASQDVVVDGLFEPFLKMERPLLDWSRLRH